MHATPGTFEEVQLNNQAARDWLHAHLRTLNAKWKHLDIQFVCQTHQQFQDDTGRSKRYICPPHYVLTYYRTRFRFFGSAQEATIRFSESDIVAILYRREARSAIWDACYYLQIALKQGQVDINYTPPFFGVTPVLTARHSEQVSITFDLHYRLEAT